jgi:hypothetical protein
MSQAYPLPAPPPAPKPSGSDREKKPKEPLQVGDSVHFAVQDGHGKGPIRHGSIVLFVDGERVLLASNPSVPNVKVIDVGTDRIGMSWVKAGYLGRGHKNCLTALTLTLEAAWALRGKILLNVGEVNETVVLSGRGSGTNTSGCNSSRNSGTASPASPSDVTSTDRPQDRELRAMVKEALQSFGPGDHVDKGNPPSDYPPGAHMESSQDESTRPLRRQLEPHLNHAGNGGLSADPSMGRDLRNLIMEAFDEGIQAFRSEQKNMDRWVGLLQERLSKVTGHFLMTWGSRLEAEMDRRLTLYSDTIRTTCDSLQALQLPAQSGQPTSARAPQRFEAMALATTQQQSNAGVWQPPRYPLDEPQSQTNSFHSSLEAPGARGNPRTVDHQRSQVSVGSHSTESTAFSTPANQHHLVMIEKIERDHARRKHMAKVIESACSCYTKDDCVPKPLYECVQSPAFNKICAVMTFFFAVIIGVEVNAGIVAALDEDDPPKYKEFASSLVTLFNIWFAVEVVLRAMTEGPVYFVGVSWRWNLFDVVLVLFSILDMISDSGTVGFLRVLRAFRVLKALRVVRVLRLFRELRLMVSQMLLSLGSLFWSLMFLLVVTYLSGVVLAQAATIYIIETSRTNETAEGVREMYSNVFEAMYTLLLSITGGIDWKDAASPVWHFGWVYGWIFMGFVLFSILGILNVVTSVFIERARNMKRFDRDYAISEELHMMERDIEDTMELFSSLAGGKESIAVSDMHSFLKEPHVIAHFATIGIDVTDPVRFEHLLKEEAGAVSIQAFVIGCVSLRGMAKQSDTLSIVVAVRKLESVVRHIRDDLHDSLQHSRRHGASSGHSRRNAPYAEGAMSVLNRENNMHDMPNERRLDQIGGGGEQPILNHYAFPGLSHAGAPACGSTDV